MPDAGRVDIETIGLAPLDDLGIASNDLHSGFDRCQAHRLYNLLQQTKLQSLFENESGRQVLGPGAHHSHVIDRAAHGQTADVTAGKEKRPDHV